MGCEPRRFDLTMLHAAYDAFRRDAARIEAAADLGGTPAAPAVANTWSLFRFHWRVQDITEKSALWSVMYAKDAGAPGRLGIVLDSMAFQAIRVVSLIDALDAALEHRDRLMFARYAQELHTSVDTLLAFKESEVLPLISGTLTAFEWGTFDVEFRRELGIRGLGVFLPWLLDDAPEATRRAVLHLLPPPIRLFYRTSWRPRYRRRSRLAVPAC
ncbi:MULTISPECIES: hypothetical protein [unclassified Spirillospora]|uniref:hypothetical protein n=1 Tax=unclassified Spirillospora TaxID=2642701 RepID=UPI00372295E2